MGQGYAWFRARVHLYLMLKLRTHANGTPLPAPDEVISAQMDNKGSADKEPKLLRKYIWTVFEKFKIENITSFEEYMDTFLACWHLQKYGWKNTIIKFYLHETNTV